MRPSPPNWLFPALALTAGVLGMAGLWTALSVAAGRALGGLALVAALDLAFLSRLAGMTPGRRRALACLAGTLACSGLAAWLTAALRVGRQFGLTPLESIQRMGPGLATELVRLGTGPWDLLGLALGLALAWRLGR